MSKNTNSFKKALVVVFTALFVFMQGPAVYAFDFPTAPSAPTPPPAPTIEETAPTPAPSPTPPPPPTWGQDEETPTEETQESSPSDTNESEDPPETSQVEEDQAAPLNGTGGQDSGGVVGDTSIDTGDATNTAVISTNANSNLSSTPSSGAGATIINDGNGSDSSNSGSALITNDSTTIQNNSAQVTSGLNQSSTTGQNSASGDVGDSTITTGDANTTGTIITAVNTNIDGVMVAEFNVVDDHIGDIVLDFGAGCISGCATSDTTLVNSGNGADSTNTATLDSESSTTTFQTNDATVENNMTLAADSGTNTTDKNTSGDSSITTGDANVAANALTFANNNIAGGVVYAVVNIFGNLVGDIIFPDGTVLPCCLVPSVSIENSGNGTDSTNTGEVNLTNTDETYQFNNVSLENNLIFDATTGDNDVSKNTGGNSSVATGDATVLAQVINVANNNLIGGDWWLVIVNEAGHWIGKILGAPDGANFAGSDGFEFLVNEAGEITVVNTGNGSGSTNTGVVNQTNTTTTVQENTANIVNNIDLSANTGGNSASKNTGGDSSIKTGDATIIANIVNFVNNNIVGDGRLFVTLVNIFGSWIGDFVGPGQHQEEHGVGGASGQASDSAGSQSSSGSSGSQGQAESLGQGATAFAETFPRGRVTVFARRLGIAGGKTASIVLGDETAGPETAAQKILRINLAWVLAALFPIGLVTVIIRRRKAVLRVLTFFL